MGGPCPAGAVAGAWRPCVATASSFRSWSACFLRLSRQAHSWSAVGSMAPKTLLDTGVSIFVRRDDGPEPGLSIVAVRPDGSEALVRKVPDFDRARARRCRTGARFRIGLACPAVVEDRLRRWPVAEVILIDLADDPATPWGRRGERSVGSDRAGADRARRSRSPVGTGRRDRRRPQDAHDRRVTVRGELVGGGPSIVWSADGRGIVDSRGAGRHVGRSMAATLSPGVGQVFDPRG